MRSARTVRRLVIICALLVTAILGAAGLLIAAQHGATLDESRRTAESLVQVLTEQTARTLQPIDMTVRDIVERLTTGPMGNASGQNGAQSWNSSAMSELLAERLKGLPQGDALFVVGAEGQVVNSSRSFPPPGLDLSKRDYFQHFSAQDDHELFVSAPVQSLLDGRWAVFLTRRVTDQHGGFAGIVAAAVTLAYLEDFYQAVLPENGSITVLRRDGLILVRKPAVGRPVGARLPPDSPWYKTLDEGGGTFLSRGFVTDVVRLVTVRSVRGFPLVINFATTRAAALAGWHRVTSWLLLGAGLAVTSVVLLLRFFGAQYNRLDRQNAELETWRLQFDAVLENMSQGITFFSEDQHLMISNRRYGELYNLSPEQTRPGTSLADIIVHRIAAGSFPDMTSAEFLARRKALTDARENYDVTDEFRDGRVVSMHYQPLSEGGWVVTHEDITDRRRSQESLLYLARHDPLTELPNRTLFQERLRQAISLVGQGTHCALLCVDLDRFKVINDTLGHPVGDQLLRAVAGRLKALARGTDTVARLGGDEFAIILVGLQAPGHAAGLAHRIVVSLKEPYLIDGHRIMAGASIGVSIAPRDGLSSDTLLKNADIALYLAKTAGRGAYRFFEPEVDAYVQRQHIVELDLRNAQPTEDFELHYQPILDLASGKVTGFEALIRWNHPEKGLINPADFIPIAEETGLIVAIGEWALRQACQEAAGWPEEIEIAVNLSPVQFRSDRLFDIVSEALEASGLNPGLLELEITESALLENSCERLALLHRIHALGVRIALDDFGTGYSSLSYLRSFPFNKIKIDRTFIREVDTNRESTAIVNAIVGLGRSLGMTTVAEGVETEQQLATVRDQGCTKVQGYLFSRPRPASEVPAMIRTSRIPKQVKAGREIVTDVVH